ncbi:MAG: tRNA (guanosine(37)-N1)-methyltransferase TrmD [Candidatus Glassbacteria bacterium]|nr:tRNA (guanosine(37)-N1)-methyltransferase TrmD [Candidatus Glassbacteria bacterium]
MLAIDLITLFPDYFRQVLETSIIGRACRDGLVRFRVVDLREFAVDKHGTVDDYPYGGGAGMVLRPEPVFEAVEHCRESVEPKPDADKSRVVLLSARGTALDQRGAERFSLLQHLVLICGHYKDVDQRVAEHLADEELRIGDYVLSGGEPAAAVVVDAVVRLLPGALGDFDSALGDSFSEGLLGPPHYTRPREFRGWQVPEILTSGNHEKIKRWRDEQARETTRKQRPDLLEL